MEYRYFLKLITGEKKHVSAAVFMEWKHNYSGDNLHLVSENGVYEVIKKSDVITALAVPFKTEFSKSENSTNDETDNKESTTDKNVETSNK